MIYFGDFIKKKLSFIPNVFWLLEGSRANSFARLQTSQVKEGEHEADCLGKLNF